MNGTYIRHPRVGGGLVDLATRHWPCLDSRFRGNDEGGYGNDELEA